MKIKKEKKAKNCHCCDLQYLMKQVKFVISVLQTQCYDPVQENTEMLKREYLSDLVI